MTVEIPNNAKPEEMMDFKKFAQSVKGLIYSDEKVFIIGQYKTKESNEIHSGDNFWAYKVHTSGKSINAKEIYKTYIEWFNRNLRFYETERIFVSAKFGKEDSA